MSIFSSESPDGKELVIHIKGRFDFSTHQDFRSAYESAPEEPEQYVVDLREATYLDSSALGMLLLLRDHAGGDSRKVRIINCNPDVKKILTISNFEQLFTIQ
ncbi:MAG: anti-anti-sigma factor [Moraxellaceae bacterium]|nr:anti-anti-sigma factor [Moraxellaceae bacterium]MDF3030532.1 anti-anti-sigma factor [Moraxellaceae bacterium]